MWTEAFEQASEHGPITCVKLSQDEKKVAISTAKGRLDVLDVESGQIEVGLFAHLKGINQVKWSLDGSYLVTCSDDGTAKVLRSSDLAKAVVFSGHMSYVTCLDIANSGTRVATGSFDESIMIWDVASGKCLRMISGHTDPVTAVAFSSDGAFVVSSSSDGACRIWEAFSGLCLGTFLNEGIPVSFSLFTPNDEFIVAAYLNSTIKFIKIRDSKTVAVFSGHVNEKKRLNGGIVHGGQRGLLYFGSETGDVVFWDIATREVVCKVEGALADGVALDCSLSGSLLVSGRGLTDSRLVLWRKEE